jgi:hypothetical protein
MTTLLDRPEVIEKPPEVLPPAPPTPPERRRLRLARWFGWLLAVGAVALVTILVVIANQDDATTTSPTAVTTTQATIFTPQPVVEPEGGLMQEATVTPDLGTRLVPHAPGFIQAPVTEFMEEATVTPGLTQLIERAFIFDRLVPEEVGIWMDVVGVEAQGFQAQVEAQLLQDEFIDSLATISNFDMDAFMAVNVALPVIPEIPPTAWTPDLGDALRLETISSFDMDAFMAVNVDLPEIPEYVSKIALPYGRTFVPEEVALWLELVGDDAQIYQDHVTEYEEFLAGLLVEAPPADMNLPDPVAL